MAYLVITVVLLHFALASIFIWDLFTVSKRVNKMVWLAFLVLVPFLSAYAYRASMKRKRRFLFY